MICLILVVYHDELNRVDFWTHHGDLDTIQGVGKQRNVLWFLPVYLFITIMKA